MVKGGDDCAPVEGENILTWANNNGMTINLTKTKKLIVRGKIERPLPPVVFDIHQEIHLKILGVYFNSDQQFDNYFNKVGKRTYILRVCNKYGFSLDCLHHIFHMQPQYGAP